MPSSAGLLGEPGSLRLSPDRSHVPEPALASACPNCGSGPIAAYCAACGERQPSHADYGARAVALEVTSEFLSVDGRLWRSIVTLLTRPGLLTLEYFSGRRGRYMRPFSLFILLNVAFFFVQPQTGLLQYSMEQYTGSDGLARQAKEKQAALFMNDAHFAQHFEDTLHDQEHSLLLFATPMLALTLMALYAGSGRAYVEHLVFSVHAYAFTVFYLTAMGTLWFWALHLAYRFIPFARPVLSLLGGELGVIMLLGAGMLTYFTKALGRFYGSPMPLAFARALVLFAVQGALIIIFRDILFHTTLAAL